MIALTIKISQSEVELKLSEKGQTIDPALEKGRRSKISNPRQALFKGGVDLQTAKYYHDLSEVLITTLDTLFKRTRIDTTALKSFKIKGNLGKDATSYKITQAFVEGLKN